jgi:hypothetical protein
MSSYKFAWFSYGIGGVEIVAGVALEFPDSCHICRRSNLALAYS